MEITIAVVIGLIFVCIVLSLATASIASAYKLIFDKLETARKRLHKDGRELNMSEQVISEERALLQHKLTQVVEAEAREFQKTLAEVRTQGLQILTTMGSNAKDEVRIDLVEFRKLLASKIDEELGKTKLELDQYKTAKKVELDQKAKEVLKEVAMQILPEAIDVDKHEDLIIKALQKAKDEHFFN